MPSITERYERSPIKWNVASIISAGSVLALCLSWWTTHLFSTHSMAANAHPVISQQLNRMEANQVSEQIEKMDARLCDDPDNNFYRIELRKLITQWEKLTGEDYPTQLLRCANNRSA